MKTLFFKLYNPIQKIFYLKYLITNKLCDKSGQEGKNCCYCKCNNDFFSGIELSKDTQDYCDRIDNTTKPPSNAHLTIEGSVEDIIEIPGIPFGYVGD